MNASSLPHKVSMKEGGMGSLIATLPRELGIVITSL